MNSTLTLIRRTFGTKPPRKWKTPTAIHASMRPQLAVKNLDELDLVIKPSIDPNVLIPKTTWSPPPKEIPNLPFVVERTGVGLSLPVYTDYKAGRTKVVTILRKCKGDINLLKSEMEKVVGKPVRIMPGKLVVDGNYSRALKIWLTAIGF